MTLSKHTGNKIKTKSPKYETAKGFEGMYTIFGCIQNHLAVKNSNVYKMAYMSNFKKAVESVRSFNPLYIKGEELLSGGEFFIKGSGINFVSNKLQVFADICPNTKRFKNLRVYEGLSLIKFLKDNK